MRHFVIIALCLSIHSYGQETLSSPILRFVEAHNLMTVKSKAEQKTRAEINGTSCAARKWTEVFLNPHGSHQFTLEYNISIDIEDDRDPCLEGDVPEIDTQFELTFADSRDSHSIDFKGETPADCKKCKPRRAHSISGKLRRLGDQAFSISFSGDLSDTVELEPLSSQ
jgi:hypothetical protein